MDVVSWRCLEHIPRIAKGTNESGRNSRGIVAVKLSEFLRALCAFAVNLSFPCIGFEKMRVFLYSESLIAAGRPFAGCIGNGAQGLK